MKVLGFNKFRSQCELNVNYIYYFTTNIAVCQEQYNKYSFKKQFFSYKASKNAKIAILTDFARFSDKMRQNSINILFVF